MPVTEVLSVADHQCARLEGRWIEKDPEDSDLEKN